MKALLILLACLLAGCATPDQSKTIYVPPGVELIEMKAAMTETGILVWVDGRAIHFEIER
jgi:uncharacterized lipoprotein YmbA